MDLADAEQCIVLSRCGTFAAIFVTRTFILLVVESTYCNVASRSERSFFNNAIPLGVSEDDVLLDFSVVVKLLQRISSILYIFLQS